MKQRIIAIIMLAFTASLQAEDWPQWGRDYSKNMASSTEKIVDSFNVGEMDYDTEEVDMKTTKNIKWIAKMGSQSYGNVTVADGQVYVGTNNESPRDPKHKGDRGVVMCFDEKDGSFKWQLIVPKLGAGKVSDWEYLGICSSPTVLGDRVYVVTNRCEVVCMDVKGMANGNDGPFKDEGQYVVGEGKPKLEVGDKDADIIWTYDMRKELGVFPHNIASSSILAYDGKIYVTTSNGQDWSHVNIPSPRAPTLICLDAKTGKLVGEEASGISTRLYHCNWSSPAFGVVNGQEMLFFGGGDGYCYGFDPKPVKEDGYDILKEIWRFNCNPPEYLMKNGKKIKYPKRKGPSEIIATPVFYKNRIYVATGQDPEHGEGVGVLSCIDATKDGDISKTGAVWLYKDIERTISTVSIYNGLVFAADYTGRVHCVDAETGKKYWVYDTQSSIWASTLVADGKVIIGNEDGEIVVLAADKKMKEIKKMDMGAPVYSSAVVANDVLYITTQTHLYAIGKPDKKK